MGWIRKYRNIISHFLPIGFICIFCLVSCGHAPVPHRPTNWTMNQIDLKSVADNPNQPLLQVIIVYGPWWCHHSALRLVYPDRPVLFWDPGGSYGEFHAEDIRSKDLIRINPPDLEAYLQFTWNYSSIEVEVFEWDLTLEHARELYDILLQGTDKNHPAGKFSTTTMGGFCSITLSNFLHRFATKTMIVPKSYLCPHNLARVLYTQSPKHVLTFRRGKQILYIPPQRASDNIRTAPISE
ncbi:MAG: hypothetical protein FJ106_15410 [Deltaproteobacteria bacterium]|nr:hypothetical protein [Deltaproteobacteria bacterium]